jgi:hypothetical protein
MVVLDRPVCLVHLELRVHWVLKVHRVYLVRVHREHLVHRASRVHVVLRVLKVCQVQVHRERLVP